MAEPGVSVYLTAAELRALLGAAGYLSSLIEQSSELRDDLASAHEGLHSVIDKAYAAKHAAKKRNTLRRAVRLAERMLADERASPQ
ncbi:hypothetical protein ABGT16_05315 [Pseudomonas asiatica]|uniref:hypothetical protein n=1 Tax=Pseudomonas asiatica TaxID=2219225 RepID=UPI00345CE012